MTESFKVVKLRGRENYDTWAIAAQSYLITKGLWEFVEDPEVGVQPDPPEDKPTDPPTEKPPAEKPPAEKPPAEKPPSKPYVAIKNDARARAEIILMIEAELYSYVGGETASDAWESLRDAFSDKGATRKVTVLNKLVRMTLEAADDNMEKYVQTMLLSWSKVKASGFKIDEEVIASVILGGLPLEYRPMILGIENSGAKLTVDYVKNVLLQGIIDEKGSGSEKAMAAKCSLTMKKGNKKRKCFTCGSLYHLSFECKQNKKKRKCFNCGKPSHIAKDCRLPKRKQGDEVKDEPKGDQAKEDHSRERKSLSGSV